MSYGWTQFKRPFYLMCNNQVYVGFIWRKTPYQNSFVNFTRKFQSILYKQN